MAVHQATGLLFVTDRAGARIRVYLPDDDDLLAHVTDIDASDRSSGDLNDPSAVTIDQQSGELYVAKTGVPAELIRFVPVDSSNPTSFTEDSSFSSPAGVDWGQASAGQYRGNVRGGLALGSDQNGDRVIFAADPPGDVIQAFDYSGAPLSIFRAGFFDSQFFNCSRCAGGAFTDLVDIASGPDGSIYAVDIKDGAMRLTRIALVGSRYDFDREWDTGLGTGLGSNQIPHVAVDQLSHEIFVVDRNRYVQIEGPSAPEIAYFSQAIPEVDGGFRHSITAVAVLGTPDPSQGGRLYFGATSFALFGAATAAYLQVYDSAGEIVDPPQVQMSPIDPDDVTATTAQVSGEVTPFEEGARWRFEARRCTESGCDPWPTEPPAGPPLQGPIVAADYDQPQRVDFELTDLEPNSDYEVRLRAINTTDSILSDPPPATLRTKAIAPSVATRPAVSIAASRATLVGEIDPKNSETHYRFELTSEGGSTQNVPTMPVVLAGDSGRTQVTAEALKLESGQLYSYRLVAYLAEDEQLKTEGDVVEFTTRDAAESSIPERAFELVSPRSTNAVNAMGNMMLAPAGNRAVMNFWIPLPDSENMGLDWRVSQRNVDGSWTTLRHKAGVPVTLDALNLDAALDPLMNLSLTHAAFRTLGGFDPEDVNGASDIYLRDVDSGAFSWQSRTPSGRSSDTSDPLYVSQDGNQVIFDSSANLLPTDQAGTGKRTLYEMRDGELRQITFRAGAANGPVDQSELGGGIGGSSGSLGSRGELRNAVSADGDRIVFTIDAVPRELYVNDGGEVIEVATGGAEFWGASADVSTVIYTKGGDLFAFDVEDEASQLVHPPVAGGAGVFRALFVSDDGNRIYFASTKDVLGGGRNTSPYGLWVAERPDSKSPYAVDWIGTVSDSDGWETITTARQYGADPNGDILAFRSSTRLVPGRDTGGIPQAYVYERDRKEIYCLSCPPDGSDPAPYAGSFQGSGGATTGTSNRVSFFNYANRPPRVISDDGSVIFQTVARLVPTDVNDWYDVYEWRGGEISMLTPGNAVRHASLGEISSDGRTVLLSSTSNLVPGLPESDVQRIYAARVGGGYTSSEVPEAVCQGAECRGSEAQPPPPLGRSATNSRRHSDAGKGGEKRCQPLVKQSRVKRRGLKRQQARFHRLRVASRIKAASAARKRIRRQRAQLKRLNRRLSDCRRAA